MAAAALLAGSGPGSSDRAVVDLGPVTSFAAEAAPGVYYLSLFAASGCGFSRSSNTVVLHGTGSGATDAAQIVTGGPSLRVDAPPAGTFYVRVRAIDATNASSAPSAEIIIVIR